MSTEQRNGRERTEGGLKEDTYLLRMLHSPHNESSSNEQTPTQLLKAMKRSHRAAPNPLRDVVAVTSRGIVESLEEHIFGPLDFFTALAKV